jgi:hypothetical protein
MAPSDRHHAFPDVVRFRRHGGRPKVLVVLERVLLGAATMILSINIWTGFPLVALWIGSQFAHGNYVSMGAIVIAIVALIAFMVAGLYALAWISARYDHLTGRRPPTREPAPWLRSMRADRDDVLRRSRETNAVEAIVVATVVVAFLAFEIWFFFFAGSPVPHGS